MLQTGNVIKGNAAGFASEIQGQKQSRKRQGAKLLPSLLVLTAASVFWMMAPPEGLTAQTWHLLIIFIATVVAVILKPLPIGSISLIATTFCITTQTLTLDQALTAFSSGIVWLVVLAFFLAMGFKNTGLGTRIAYFFVALLGKSTLGLSYGFVLTELLLAPFVPSNTARGAGIIFPVVNALAKEQGSDPKDKTERKLGSFLLTVCFQVNMVTSAMFLTGLVGNPLIANLAQSANVTIDWGTWALAAIVPGLANLALIPWALYKFYPPEVTHSPKARLIAKEKLKNLGPLSMNEKLMLATFAGILTLWIFGGQYGIKPTTAALIGFAILLFFGVLSWKDCIKETGAWETLMWFAPFLMMAGFLTKFGMMEWFSLQMKGVVGGLSWPVTFVIVAFVYFYIHYLFASVTARITALYGALLAVLVAAGTPPMLAAMGLAVLSALAGTLTHFGTGTAPVYFGAGYVSVKDWWRNSFFLSAVNLTVWAVVGGIWWKCLGYW